MSTHAQACSPREATQADPVDQVDAMADPVDPGNAPADQVDAGNASADQVDAGNAPADPVDAGNAPADQVDAGNAPADQVDASNGNGNSDVNNPNNFYVFDPVTRGVSPFSPKMLQDIAVKFHRRVVSIKLPDGVNQTTIGVTTIDKLR